MTDKVTRVSVKSVNQVEGITVKHDASVYYSELSEKWAHGDGLIENIDYSSKHYAGVSKQHAENAQATLNQATEVISDATDVAVVTLNETTTAGVNAIDSAVVIGRNNINAVGKEYTTEMGIIYNNTETVAQEAKDTLENTLNKSQITNCILEVPQRLNVTVADGTITLKAGSVVIVPYGTTDRSSEFSVGSSFINSNFEVFDTSYSNKRFFVFAKTKKDLSYKYTGANTIGLFKANITTASGTGEVNINNVSGNSASITAYMIWYDTVNNYVKRSTDGVTWSNDVFSLPCAEMTMVKDVGVNSARSFNGFGYIGRHMWFDKGIKCLFGIKRNQDGTIENQEHVTKFHIWETHTWTEGRLVCINSHGTQTDIMPSRLLKGLKSEMPSEIRENALHIYICTDTLEVFYTNTKVANWKLEAQIVPIVEYGAVSPSDGTTLTYFKPYQAFRAVDYNEFGNLRETVDTLNDTKVPKTGDTTITGQVTLTRSNNPAMLRLRNNTLALSDIPTSNAAFYGYIYFTDKNGQVATAVESFKDTSGNNIVQLFPRKPDNSGWGYALQVGVTKDNVPFLKYANSEVRFVKTTYQNGTSGYRVWSDGYGEQWGEITATKNTNTTVTFLKTFKDTNYNVQVTAIYSSADDFIFTALNKTTTTMQIHSSVNAEPQVGWRACGYLASGQY